MIFTATIDNGKLLTNWFGDYIKSIKDWDYIIEIKKATRTQQQNRLYWGILEQIEKETGNDKDDLHNFFKDMFLKRPVISILWEYSYIPTTTELSKEEFVEYVDKVMLFCLEQWLEIKIM